MSIFKINFNKFYNILMDKDETLLNNLREEYTTLNAKKNFLRNHNEIIRE